MDVIVIATLFMAIVLYVILHIRHTKRRRQALLRDRFGRWKAVGAPEVDGALLKNNG